MRSSASWFASLTDEPRPPPPAANPDGIFSAEILSGAATPVKQGLCDDLRGAFAASGRDAKLTENAATVDVAVMLVSDYPDAPKRALADGADRGFGKAALDAPEIIERLAKRLPRKEKQAAPR